MINSTQVRVWPSDHQAVRHPRQFGYSMALDGRALAIGAFLGGPEVQNAGAVYLFDLEEGLLNETEKLTASDASEDDQFGMSVAMDRPYMITGAIFADNEGRADAGAAYL